MSNILKCDLYRFSRAKLFYGLAVFAAIVAISLTMAISQNMRIGISVFGELTAFRGIDDIVRVGMKFDKGLGVIIAIALSVFIGQEYQWKTWQHKWVTNKSRAGIYVSKVFFSCVGSALVFLIYQMTVLLCGGQIQTMLTGEYVTLMISGVFIYAALGAVICMFSMLIRSGTASVIVCLCYVLFIETIISVTSGIGNVSAVAGRFVGFAVRHSVFGMSTIVSDLNFVPEYALTIALNSLAIIIVTTLLGLAVFRRYEL